MTRSLLLGFFAFLASVTLAGCGGDEKCLGGSTSCGGTCVDLQNDHLNCGACGNACDTGTCFGGVCGGAPAACLGSTDPISGAPWTVCASSLTEVWVSHATAGGGQFHADWICKQLGYGRVGRYGGTCGNVCGYCQAETTSCTAPGNKTFDRSTGCTSDEFGQVLCDTVHWTCLNTEVVEDFERTPWPWSPWALREGGTNVGTTTAACAREGTLGLAPGSGAWYSRTDMTIGNPGERLSWWVKTAPTGTTGRAYMGFGATATGAFSLVLATNSDSFVLQSNAGWTFTDVASVAQTYTADTWYRVEATIGTGGAVTGRLYGSNGNNLLNTVTGTLTGYAPGGVALRGFGMGCMDAMDRYVP